MDNVFAKAANRIKVVLLSLHICLCYTNHSAIIPET